MTIPVTPLQSAFGWLWETFGKELMSLGWNAVQWKHAVNGYADKIEKDYGKLYIYGRNEFVPIDDLFTYVQLLERDDALFQSDEGNLIRHYVQRTLRYDPDSRRNGWRMVQDGQNLFVLGDPGAGKTTFLKKAAIQAAKGELKKGNGVRSRIPIFIRLREHALSDRTLYESIKRELKVCGFPDIDLFVEKLLNSGRALLLWDALDEVKTEDDQRSKLVAEMHELMRDYDDCQYVISCRVAAADYTFGERDGMQYVRMAPFDNDQIEHFLGKWFGENKTLAAECFADLTSNKNKGLRELARTPILLTLLAIAYKRRLGFPKRRIEIYENAIDALLRGWDAERGIRRGETVYEGLELGYKWDLMTEVAAEAFFNDDFLLARREWGERIRDFLKKLPEIPGGADGGVVLDAIASKHGLFVKQTADLYSLAHLSFQEYFTARYIKEELSHGSLERLLDHINDDQWREVFLLTASSLKWKDANKFFTLFMARLNEMVADNGGIQGVLAWAVEKQEQYTEWALAQEKQVTDSERVKKLAYRPISLRAHYLSRALALDLDLARDLDLAVARALDLDRALARARDLARALARDRAHYLSLSLALSLALALARDRDRDRALALARDLGLYALADRLADLSVPSKDALEAEWAAYAEALRPLIDESRDLTGLRRIEEIITAEEKAWLEAIEWDKASVKAFTAYVEGTNLLVDCLELAMISNRAGIEARLLVPA